MVKASLGHPSDDRISEKLGEGQNCAFSARVCCHALAPQVERSSTLMYSLLDIGDFPCEKKTKQNKTKQNKTKGRTRFMADILAAWSFNFFELFWRSLTHRGWPCGPMDKAPDYGSGDSRFESWHGRIMVSHPFCHLALTVNPERRTLFLTCIPH